MSRDVIYLRKSRMEANSDTEETLERHKKTLLDFAERNNLCIVEVYEEVVSGETLYARPKMLRLLDDLEHEHYDSVLCMDIDRLGRSSMSDQGIILEAFKRNGTRIITPRKVYDLNNDMDETYSEFESFMARQELKIIKRRLRNGIRRTVSDGGYIANAPYGYTKTKQNKLPTLAVCESEAAYVRMIFDMYTNQGAGGQVIADALNSLGARPHRAKQFGRTSVLNILRNPVYIGKVTWNRKQFIKKMAQGGARRHSILNAPENWTVVDGLHPSIIDQELFDRTQEVLRGRYHSPSFTGTVENPLAGLILCGNCGGLMQRQYIHRDGSKAWESVLCPKKGCIPSVKLAYLEAAVLEYLRDAMLRIAADLKPGATSQDSALLLQPALDATRHELNTLTQQQNRLHDFLEQGVYDIDTFLTRSRTLNERTAALTEQAAAQEAIIQKAYSKSTRTLYNKIKSVLQAYDAADAQEKNAMLKTVIQDVTYSRTAKSKPREFTVSVRLQEE